MTGTKEIHCTLCNQSTQHEFRKLIPESFHEDNDRGDYSGDRYYSVWACMRCARETSSFEYENITCFNRFGAKK
jgi:hypothetical protein